jgi:hypothetical protein
VLEDIDQVGLGRRDGATGVRSERVGDFADHLCYPPAPTQEASVLTIVPMFLFVLFFRYRKRLSWWKTLAYSLGWTVLLLAVVVVAASLVTT